MDPSILLFVVLAVLLVFMFFNTRKRQKQMKEQQAQKAAQTVPGAKVLLQGGLYGTIVSYDPEDLDRPAEVEIAPGTVIEVHSQAILRVVDPIDDEVLTTADFEASAETDADVDESHTETVEETRARLERDADK